MSAQNCIQQRLNKYKMHGYYIPNHARKYEDQIRWDMDISTPDNSTPDNSTPDISTPEISTPDISTPDNSTPTFQPPTIQPPTIQRMHTN